MFLPAMLASLLAFAAPDDPVKVEGIAPIVGEDVAVVVRLDLGRFDPQGLARKLGGDAEVAAFAVVLKSQVDALKRSGVRELYLLSGPAELAGLPILAAPMPLGGEPRSIAEVLKAAHPSGLAAEEIRGVVVAASPAALARIREAKPTPRPDLAAALASGGDPEIRVAISPGRALRRAVEESLPTLPPSLGGRPIEALTRGMAWASIGLGADPTGPVRVVVRGSDRAASEQLGAVIRDGFAGFATTLEADPAQSDLARSLRRLKPEVGAEGVSLAIPADQAAALVSIPIRQAREATHRSGCINNLKQIGLAMHNYHSTYNSFPPAFIASEDGKPLLSWRVLILPFLEAESLYKEFHLDEAWDSPHNKPLIGRMPAYYACPSMAKGLALEGKTTYLTPRGPGTLFPGPQGVKIQDITDGTSNTLFVVDVKDGAAVTWTRPDDLLAAPLDLASLGQHHAGGTVAGLADGAVKFIKASVTARTWQCLTTKDGGEVVNWDDF